MVNPIRKLPTILTVNVEYGKDSLGINLFIKNLIIDPKPPPKKTRNKFFILSKKITVCSND